MVLAMLGWIASRAGIRRAVWPAALVLAAGLASVATNFSWFGHMLGAVPLLEALHPEIHGVTGSIGATPWIGALGLLVSPSRGLLVFSPIVLVAAIGLGHRRQSGGGLSWLVAGAAAQGIAYALYSVWWAGHTYGPRYMLDVLPLLTPVAALGWDRARQSLSGRLIVGLLLAWSVGVAALGAFVYPNEAWNTRPAEVDTHHERLWEIRDSQILRAFGSGASPQNGDLWSRGAVERPSGPAF
jgi:hypothetical protein